MLKICFCLLALSSIAFSNSIGISPHSSPKITPLGLIQNPIYCGGTPGPIYFTDCTWQPCSVKPGKTYYLETSYSGDSQKIILVIKAIIGEIPFEIVRNELEVGEPGLDYWISVGLDFSKEMENMDLQIEILNFDDQMVETCAKIAFIFEDNLKL